MSVLNKAHFSCRPALNQAAVSFLHWQVLFPPEPQCKPKPIPTIIPFSGTPASLTRSFHGLKLRLGRGKQQGSDERQLLSELRCWDTRPCTVARQGTFPKAGKHRDGTQAQVQGHRCSVTLLLSHTHLQSPKSTRPYPQSVASFSRFLCPLNPDIPFLLPLTRLSSCLCLSGMFCY